MQKSKTLRTIAIALTLIPTCSQSMFNQEVSFHGQLASALKFDNRSAMKRLLTKATINEMKDENTLEALLRVGSADLLQSYIFHNIDLHKPVGMFKLTALAYAMIHKDTEPKVITLLEDAEVPLCWPTEQQSGEPEEDPLYFCTDPETSVFFKRLVLNGAPIRSWHRGYHPLISAAKQGSSETVSFILSCGISHSITNDSGVTPLLAAAWNNRCEVARLLLQAGADVNTRDKRNITPLCAAAMRGYTAMTKLLLAAGADALIVDRKGKHAVNYARELGYSKIFDMLITDVKTNQEKYSWVEIDYTYEAEKFNAEVSDCEGAFFQTIGTRIIRNDIPPSDHDLMLEEEPPTDEE